MQFIENIFLLQCLEKEIATVKELDLRLLGKVIIFRDRQTDRQLLLYIDITWARVMFLVKIYNMPTQKVLFAGPRNNANLFNFALLPKANIFC